MVDELANKLLETLVLHYDQEAVVLRVDDSGNLVPKEQYKELWNKIHEILVREIVGDNNG